MTIDMLTAKKRKKLSAIPSVSRLENRSLFFTAEATQNRMISA